MVTIMYQYEKFDAEAADIYENYPKWWRFICWFIWCRNQYSFQDIENYILEHALRRRMNKLHFLGIIK